MQYFKKWQNHQMENNIQKHENKKKQPMRGSKMEEFSANQNFVFFTLI